MGILNYTTSIDSYKTIMEIQQILSKAGATKIIIDNDTNGMPVSLTFCILWKESQAAFTLPCKFNGVLRSMKNNKRVPRNLCTEAQALRVGWRIIKSWVEAQLAIVEADLAEMAEIFLPYAITKSGNTFYHHVTGNHDQLLLT